jgi:hypothetical protein
LNVVQYRIWTRNDSERRIKQMKKH